MHISLETMTSYGRRTKGDIPPRLVGPTTTVVSLPDPSNPRKKTHHVFLFGGRLVSTRRVVSSMYVLDLDTLVWEQIDPGRHLAEGDSENANLNVNAQGKGRRGHESSEANENWPAPRYFHSADTFENRLIIFGGMGYTPPPSVGAFSHNYGTTESISATAISPTNSLGTYLARGRVTSPNQTPQTGSSNLSAPRSNITPTPCVLNDVHIFDCVTRTWAEGSSEGEAGGEQARITSDGMVPKARYAHLSAISNGNLYIMGGQDIANEYILETGIYNIAKGLWLGTQVVSDKHRGSYRSVAVSSQYRVSETSISASIDANGDPLHRLPLSNVENGGGGKIFMFSNSNFTDVKRELQALSPKSAEQPELETVDVTSQMGGIVLPPGLRFPFGAILGHHLVIAGTYLSASVQAFAVWALDLRTYTWRRLEAFALDGPGTRVDVGDARPGGSWNRAVCWEDKNRLLVFGNKYCNLQDDYEHRAVNFNHVVQVELEVFGIYRLPVAPSISPEWQTQMLRALDAGKIADFTIVSDDGRGIPCSRRILEERWPWLRSELTSFKSKAQGILEQQNALGPQGEGLVPPPFIPITISTKRLTPTTLYLSEAYPICLALIQYLYTSELITKLQNQPPVLCGLLALAKQFDFLELEKVVVHAMHQRLTEDTALGIYEIATLCGCSSLQIRALKMVLLVQKKPKRPSNSRRRRGSETSLLKTASSSDQQTEARIPTSTPLAKSQAASGSSHPPGSADLQTGSSVTNPTRIATHQEGHSREQSLQPLLKALFDTPPKGIIEPQQPVPNRHTDDVPIASSQSANQRLAPSHSFPLLPSIASLVERVSLPNPSQTKDRHRQDSCMLRQSRSLHDLTASRLPLKNELAFPSFQSVIPNPSAEEYPEYQSSRRRSDSLTAIHHFSIEGSPTSDRDMPFMQSDSPRLTVDGPISPPMHTAHSGQTEGSFTGPPTPGIYPLKAHDRWLPSTQGVDTDSGSRSDDRIYSYEDHHHVPVHLRDANREQELNKNQTFNPKLHTRTDSLKNSDLNATDSRIAPGSIFTPMSGINSMTHRDSTVRRSFLRVDTEKAKASFHDVGNGRKNSAAIVKITTPSPRLSLFWKPSLRTGPRSAGVDPSESMMMMGKHASEHSTTHTHMHDFLGSNWLPLPMGTTMYPNTTNEDTMSTMLPRKFHQHQPPSPNRMNESGFPESSEHAYEATIRPHPACTTGAAGLSKTIRRLWA